MDVPVDACAGWEGVVVAWEELAGDVGGDDLFEECVEGEREEDFVDVEGEGGEVEGGGGGEDEVV